MSNNNSSNNSNRGGKNGKNGGFRGVLTLIVWALVLTVAFQYFNAYNNNAANKSPSHEIKYSDMISMIEACPPRYGCAGPNIVIFIRQI